MQNYKRNYFLMKSSAKTDITVTEMFFVFNFALKNLAASFALFAKIVFSTLFPFIKPVTLYIGSSLLPLDTKTHKIKVGCYVPVLTLCLYFVALVQGDMKLYQKKLIVFKIFHN